MSILKKPYEIAVYEDIWDEVYGKFKEQRLAVIGSDKMEYAGRVFEPVFTQSTNGSKNLTFKLYRYFYDEFGEKVSNPFFDYLISERKVKLYYKNKWHDFIIKNISENSTNYLYTYQLEDALVQELSKNGFGVTFDQTLNNNTGTASYLATETLKETDWKVIEPEVFVQTVEEDLVYLQLRVKEGKTFACARIFDQTNLTSGVAETSFTFDASFAEMQNIELIDGEYVFEIFGFYSCCRNEPYRFQFIYLGNEEPTKKQENRILQNKDCQYFIDLPNGGYSKEYCVEALRGHGFSLPQDLDGAWTINHVVSPVGDQTVSALYRGARYGYAQQAEYLPQLERYVNLYKKNEEDWYGYEENEYVSPEFVVNCITNPKFDSTSGWVAGKANASVDVPKIENVLGKFNNNKFISFAETLGKQTLELTELSNYLKVKFDNNQQYLFNTGPTDNKGTIGYMGIGDVWALQLEIVDESNNRVEQNEFDYNLAIYNRSTEGVWSSSTTFTCTPSEGFVENKYKLFTVATNSAYADKEEYKKYCKIKVAIKQKDSDEKTYYIKKAVLFKVTYTDDGTIIPPSEEVDLNEVEKSVVIKHCYYFPKSSIAENTSKDSFVPEVSLTELDNQTYIPQFNAGAEKIRSISAKESNYFNILQTISETFGGWVLLDAVRDENGAITQKNVLLKNYLGKENYAKIQYGVNLRDIQRTYESKNIVTKLIVKQNSNELAPNGFCTIARSKVNPTGENYIYDFQYYFNKGLLDPDRFIEELYDGDGEASDNIKGYFPRLRQLNDEILEINEELDGYYSDITKLKAEIEVAKQGYLTAEEELRLTEEDFLALTGLDINDLCDNSVVYTLNQTENTLFAPYKTGEELEDNKVYISYLNEKVVTDIHNLNSHSQDGYFRVLLKRKNGQTGEIKGYMVATPTIDGPNGTKVQRMAKTSFTMTAIENEIDIFVELSPIDTTRSDVRRLINDYQNYYVQIQDFDKQLLSLLGTIEYHKFMQTNEKPGEDYVYGQLTSKEDIYNDRLSDRQQTLNAKTVLNKMFFEKYSRFIQEGTWISEEYVDDDKYYHDANSVLYNSCYPKVAYSINLAELSVLPGYELFELEVGDKTWVVDPEFFENEGEVEIVVNQKSENLDSPDKSTISVQNFKNQFQDLFQKITATVQQTQYSQGSYQKGAALAEASSAKKMSFVGEALADATAKLSAAGQQSVEWGNDGITVTDVNTPTNQVRMIGGAILLSKQDEKTGELKWTTGMTADGISASLLTAGRLNTNEVAIMNGDDVLFRWDSFGISAFDYAYYTDSVVDAISKVNPEKFVRFDKHGIYGVNQNGVSGLTWKPKDIDEIDDLSTFALTWEGLKVKGENATLRIGDGAKIVEDDDTLLNIQDNEGNISFAIKNDGSIIWGTSNNSSSPTQVLYSSSKSSIEDKPVDGEQWTNFPLIDEEENGVWHREIGKEDKFASYTYNGGVTWQSPIQIVGTNGAPGKDGADGKDGTDGANVYILFHDYVEEGTPESPTKSYFEYPEYKTTGWYRVQQSEDDNYKGSVYSCSKVATPEEESEVTWGPVVRISGVLTDRKDLLSLLNNKADGIYNDDGNIAINATAIKTGTLLVGEAEEDGTPNDKTILKAYLGLKKESGEWEYKPEVYLAGWKVNEKGLIYLEDDKYYSGFTSYNTFLVNELKDDKIIQNNVALFAGNTLTERTKIYQADSSSINKQSISYQISQDSLEQIMKALQVTSIDDLEVELTENKINYSYNVTLYERKGNSYEEIGSPQGEVTIELQEKSEEQILYTGTPSPEPQLIEIERDKKFIWAKLGFSNLSLPTSNLSQSVFQGKIYGGVDFEKCFVRIDDTGVETNGTAQISYSLGNPIEYDSNGQYGIGGVFKIRFSPYIDPEHGFDQIGEMIGIRLTSDNGTGAVAYLCLTGVPDGDKVFLGWNIFSGQNVHYDEEKAKTVWENSWYNPGAGDGNHWGQVPNFAILLDSSGKKLEIPSNGVDFSDWTEEFLISILSDDPESGAVELYYKIGYDGKIIYDSENWRCKGENKDIHFIQPQQGREQKLIFTPYYASRCKFDIAEVCNRDWCAVSLYQSYTKNYYDRVEPSPFITTNEQFIFSSINNNPKFYVTHDGYLNAQSGKIGNLIIENIPDEGYVASSVDSKFSWQFSPTDGMFMWNGAIPKNPVDEKTKDAIFSIYNDGTQEKPDFKLSMKGHINAKSGYIGKLSIDENGLNLTHQNTFLSKEEKIEFGAGNGLLITTISSSSGGSTIQAHYGTDITITGNTEYDNYEKTIITLNGISVYGKEEEAYVSCLKYEGLEFCKKAPNGGLSGPVAKIIVDDKGLKLFSGGNWTYLKIDENGTVTFGQEV